jgi:hypothetical protein
MQLRRRFFWNRSTNDDEPFGAFPAMGTVSELRCPHLPSNASVAKPTKAVPKWSSQPSDNHKQGLFSFDKFDNFVIEERSIGAHADLTDSTGKLAEDVFQQWPDHTARMSVAWMIAAGENICCLSLEAQQGRVGRTTSLGGIETNDRTLLPTVDSQHGCIQIEDRTRSRVSTAQHFLSPPVVECNEFVSPQEAKALQKATERRGCWVTGKSCQVLKDPLRRNGSVVSTRPKPRIRGYNNASIVSLIEYSLFL